MKFEVKYRDKHGLIVTSVVDVADRNGVYSELRRQGISPISMSEISDRKNRKHAPDAPKSLLSRLLFVLVFAAAVFAAWYFFFANPEQKDKVGNIVTGLVPKQLTASKPVSESNPEYVPPAPPKKRGTGAVKIKLTK